MPTFYQAPGIGQLDSSHIDSDSFSYVEGLVTDEEWAALNAVDAEAPGLSAPRFAVHGHGEGPFTEPGEDAAPRLRSWYVPVEVADVDGTPTFGTSMFPVRYDQLVMSPGHLPIKRDVSPRPPAPPPAAAAGGTQATLTTVITPTSVVMSPAFNPATTPIVAWQAQLMRKPRPCHQGSQPGAAKIEQLVANLAPAIGDQAIADGILSKTIDEAFAYLTSTFKCAKSTSAVMREARTRKCTDATGVAADYTGKILVDACNAHGHQALEAWGASMSEPERALIYSDLAATMLTGMAPAARSAFTRDMGRTIDECTTLAKLNAIRTELNAEYINRMKFRKTTSANAATGSSDKLPQRNKELEQQLAKQQSEIKQLKSKPKRNKGNKPFPSSMPNCRHCADAPVEVEGFPGAGRHWHRACPKAPAAESRAGGSNAGNDSDE